MNVFLDLDDVVFDWHGAYANYFNTSVPKRWHAYKGLFKERLDTLAGEKEFWLNLPIKNMPDFMPTGFVTARGIPKTWTMESLKLNQIPGRSKVIQIHWGESKLKILQDAEADIFIDDRVATFRELNKNGVFCLLMTASHNRNIETPYRINDLKLENIINLWKQLR